MIILGLPSSNSPTVHFFTFTFLAGDHWPPWAGWKSELLGLLLALLYCEAELSPPDARLRHLRLLLHPLSHLSLLNTTSGTQVVLNTMITKYFVAQFSSPWNPIWCVIGVSLCLEIPFWRHVQDQEIICGKKFSHNFILDWLTILFQIDSKFGFRLAYNVISD